MDLFYSLGLFFVLYLLHEIINYKYTKHFLQRAEQVILNDTEYPDDLGSKFVVDFLGGVWIFLSVIISIWNGLWFILGLSVGIGFASMIQTGVIVRLIKKGNKIIGAYYIFTIIILVLLADIIYLVNPLDF